MRSGIEPADRTQLADGQRQQLDQRRSPGQALPCLAKNLGRQQRQVLRAVHHEHDHAAGLGRVVPDRFTDSESRLDTVNSTDDDVGPPVSMDQLEEALMRGEQNR